MTTSWLQEFSAAVTVCDAEGKILEMNDAAAKAFEKYGGASLVGSNLMTCHGEASQAKLREMLASKEANVYTVEKGGVKKLIYQAPWCQGGQLGGLVEIMLTLPAALPHHNRDAG